ncbi:MAG: RNA polymerase factor sigma-54 [Deltaproteobacteria bacterium]|jgi:RNA polymerase sigma-54 factor|nr:RNA polymerase factor sigma-54 [Deltaproteobacteria bacterium]
MAMELHLTQKQTQTMVMTPQLQQAIKLLQMNHIELTEEITNEMMSNPLLELTSPGDSAEGAAENSLEDPDWDRSPAKASEAGDAAEFAEAAGVPEEKVREEIDWENYLEEYSSGPSTALASGSHETPEETPGFESFTAAKTSLTDHLEAQWRFVARDRADFLRGVYLIGNLTDKGYLAGSVADLAGPAGASEADLEDTLRRVQLLDPPGIAARDIPECLLIQLANMDLTYSPAAEICRKHLKLLEKKDLPGLCKALQCTEAQVKEALATLKRLNPFPGLAFSIADPVYVTPDVYIRKVGDEYMITLNEDGMPKLKFSSAYRRLLADKSAPDDTRKYLNDKLKGATFLIRSIHQRQRTIYRVTESIFRFQREFLDFGVEHLKPLVLRDVADDLGFHESTISRVTTNKYVDTPRGVFELKYFFDSPISRFQGESLSSESVKNRIRLIIGAEDPKKPLSDQRIVEILRGANIDIARRTVAKYREILGLGSSSDRRSMY